MSEDGRFFRHPAQGAPVSCNSRYATPQYFAEAERLAQIESIFKRSSPICNSTFGAFCEARPLSRGLFSTAHPYFLLFDTAKLDSPDAAYLRSKKNLQKIFRTDRKTVILDASKIISKFAPYTNLLKMEVVKLNRIKAVLAETDKQGKWLAQQLGKDPTTVSKWCTNTIQPDLKTLAEIAELLNVNIRELLVNTK